MDRINGYKIVDDFELLSDKRVSRNTVYKLTDGEMIWYFKALDLDERYKELFYSILLNYLNLPAIKVDFAKYHNSYGIISQSYNPKDLAKYSIADIIQKYSQLEYYKNQKLFSVEKLPEILELFCVQNGYQFSDLKEEIFNKFMIQILLGNSDLNSQNIELILDDTVILSPDYDFETCGEINIKDPLFTNCYMLKYKASAENYESVRFTIKDFLETGTQKEIEIFKMFLECMQDVKMKIITDQMKKTIEKSIPYDTKNILKRNYRKNLKNIDAIVKGKIN